MSTTNLVKVFILTLVMTLKSAVTQEIPRRCQTSFVSLGVCVLLKDCPALLPLTESLSIGEFLRRYGCGHRNGITRLCCATENEENNTMITESTSSSASGGGGGGIQTHQYNCGQRVVGQGPEWPFLAAVGRHRQGQFEHHCNGVFISNQWVLVDGFCIMGNFISHVIPGSAWVNGQSTEFLKISQRRLGEYTDDGRYSKSLALLQLEQPLIFNDFVQSICLPNPQEMETPSLLQALNIGKSSNGLQIAVKAVKKIPGTSNVCDTAGDISQLYKSYNHIDMCTTGAKMCQGTQPLTPLVVHQDVNTERYQIQGLGGASQYLCIDAINVYSAVTPQIKWIETHLKDTSSLSSLVRTSGEIHQCGRRAVGDGPDFPFIVAIGRLQNDVFTISCGGIIIDSSWILTEAACIVDSFISHAKIGLNSNNERAVAIVSRKRHESYDPTTKEANIGMLKLETPLIFDDDVQAICLPSSSEISKNVMVAVVVQVEDSSFGSTGGKVFKQAFNIVNYVNQAKCEATGDLSHPFNSDTICASGAKACTYSTRMILLRRDPETSVYSVEGLGGYSGYPCIDDAQAYTRVIPYLQWIYNRL